MFTNLKFTAGFVACFTACYFQAGPVLADAARPNIIVIYTDDQGAGDASCLNPNSKFKTPNLDRLAREGIVFLDGHSSDTVCTPSRYGLLTGRYSWRTTLKKGVMGAEGDCLIADGRMTLASLLKSAGYHTGMVGKWHLGMDFPGTPTTRDWTQPVRDMPLDKGFEHYYGIPASMNYGVLAWFDGRYAKVPPTLFTAKKPNAIAIDDYRIMPPYQETPEDVVKVLGKEGLETAPDFVDSQCLTRFTDKAIEWLEGKKADAHAGKPFFLYLPYTSPHKPVIPLPEFRGQGDAGAYGEFMIETDHHVGRILTFLDEAELAENTMVIFTSDNGPETTWKKRIPKHNHYSAGIYREGKRSIYEGGHRVPFFVRWPAGIKQPGRTSDRTVCQTDLLATIADVVGSSIPDDAGEDSVSFAGVLSGSEAETRKLPLVHHASSGRFAIRDGDWKLVMGHRKIGLELYQLSVDPSEKNDVVKQHPGRVKAMSQKLSNIVGSGRTTAGERQSNDTEYWSDLSWMKHSDYEAAQRE